MKKRTVQIVRTMMTLVVMRTTILVVVVEEIKATHLQRAITHDRVKRSMVPQNQSLASPEGLEQLLLMNNWLRLKINLKQPAIYQYASD